MSTDKYQTLKRFHDATGGLNYTLTVFGDALAKRQGYTSPRLQGMDAVHYYLVHKFSWLPRDVRTMSPEDIRFVLEEELTGFVLPAEAR